MNCIDLMSKQSKNAKLQKQSNNDEFASIWRQNDQKCWVTSKNIQNNAKLQKWSNYNELHRFDVKTIKTDTSQNYKSDQITMHCIDLMSKLSKLRKTTKVIKLRWICIDLTSKLSKMLRYVAKLQNWSNYNELHRFDVKTIKTFELGRKTTKVIKLQWIASIWHQNNQKMLSYVVKHSKLRKTTKGIKLQWIASIWHQNDQKCWDTSQNYKSDHITIWICIDLTSKNDHNNAKLRKWSNYNALHQFDVKTI